MHELCESGDEPGPLGVVGLQDQQALEPVDFGILAVPGAHVQVGEVVQVQLDVLQLAEDAAIHALTRGFAPDLFDQLVAVFALAGVHARGLLRVVRAGAALAARVPGAVVLAARGVAVAVRRHLW